MVTTERQSVDCPVDDFGSEEGRTNDFVRVLGVDADAAIVREAAKDLMTSAQKLGPHTDRVNLNARLFGVVVTGQDAHVGARHAH